MKQPLQLSPLRAAPAAATVQLHGACGTGTGLFWHWGGVAVVSRCGHFGDNIPPSTLGFSSWVLALSAPLLAVAQLHTGTLQVCC